MLSRIEERRFRMDWVSDARAGAEALSAGKYDLAFIDYFLYEGTSESLIRDFGSVPGGVPMVVMTGHGHPEIDRVVIDLGAVDYLTKQEFNPEALERVIRHSLVKKAQEERLVEAKLNAERANAQKTEFLAMISHEIRTPMTAVLGLAQMLLQKEEDSGKVEDLNLILKSGDQILKLLNDLLDVSKIEAGMMELSVKAFNLHKLAEDVVKTFYAKADWKTLELKLEIGPIVPIWVAGDESKLRQVLVNLLSNALKFTNEGGVTLKVCRLEADRTSFEVVDSGIGMTEDEQKRIFQPYVQADLTTAETYGGTGLGLTICRSLIALMGGEPRITSEKGVGTTVFFDVPLPESEAPVVSREEDYDTRVDFDFAEIFPLKILVVEDNLVNRKVIGKMLSRLGYDPDFATDGVEAVEQSCSGNFDVVLMDMRMPNLDGVRATRRILRTLPKDSQPTIVGLTANCMEEDIRACLSAGMVEVLSKPVKIDQLKRVLAGRSKSR